MKRITLTFMSLLIATCVLAADRNGRFFLRLQGERISTENAVSNFAQWFSLPTATEWAEVSRDTDAAGMQRIVYRQYVDGVEVEHSQVILHIQNGVVRTANGTVMETRRTPAKLRKRTADKNSKPSTAKGQELLLVNTADGYRYAYKKFAESGDAWVYYDAETSQVIKRIPVRHHFDTPTGTPTTMTGKSIYNGDVMLNVMKGDDGITYLYDQARNIHTLNGAYHKSFDELVAAGTLWNYFPQGEMPDNPADATESEVIEWGKMLEELAGRNQLPHVIDYIKDYSSYIVSPDDLFSAYTMSTLGVSKLTMPDADGNLVDFLPSQDESPENTPQLDFHLRYGANVENISHGVIDDLWFSLDKLAPGIPIADISEIIPKEGITITVELTPPLNSGKTDKEEIATVAFVPDASGKFDFQNDRIAFTVTYQPSGDPAVDVHWGMGKTLDFYDEVFSRKSYDDQGSPVYNLIYLPEDGDHLFAVSGANAAAISTLSPYPMLYGMGRLSPFMIMRPVVELSIMAHEFTHIVTDMTAKLEYQGESGALNESFSDIMGISTKKYVNPSANWFLGEGIMPGLSNVRDMANPKNSMDGIAPNPDTYKGLHWADTENNDDDAGGVHTNSSVQNKWYYLLTEGGNGTNDYNYAYNVAGIGIEKSRQIAYLTLTSYATEQSDYAAISQASIEAASVLYGDGGREADAVVNAWKAVGVLAPDYTVDIQSIVAPEKASRHYYNLLGRQLNGKPCTKGVYVYNGRKVVMK